MAYYARLDWLGKAYAFNSKKERDLYLASISDLSAKKITRTEAEKYAKPLYRDGDSYKMGIPVFGKENVFHQLTKLKKRRKK